MNWPRFDVLAAVDDCTICFSEVELDALVFAGRPDDKVETSDGAAAVDEAIGEEDLFDELTLDVFPKRGFWIA